MSSVKLAITWVAALAAFGLAILAFRVAAQTHSTPAFVGVVVVATIGAVLISGLRYLTARRQSHQQLTGGEQYRALAEEYRRLADLAITAQEHTDLKMGEVSVQLDYLRTQNEAMQKILRDVE
jgi:hypothetical protein